MLGIDPQASIEEDAAGREAAPVVAHSALLHRQRSMHAVPRSPSAPGWARTTLRRGDALAFAAGPAAVFVSLYDEDHSGVYRSADDGATWTPAGGGMPEGASVAALCWHDGRLLAGTVGAGLFASADDGATWTAAGDGLPGDVVYALAARGDVLFAGTGADGVFRSSDGGATWTPAGRGLPSGGRGLAVFGLAADDTGVVAHHAYGLHRSADDGATWTAVGAGLPAHTALTLLAAHEGHLYASSPGRLYHSPDGGATWTAHAGGLWAQRLVRALVVCGDTLFAGTQGTNGSGLYASNDGGFTWTPLHHDLPADTWSVNVFATSTHLLAGAGTHGVWRRTLADATAVLGPPRPYALPFHLEQNDPNPFDRGTRIAYTLSRPGHAVLEVCDLVGHLVATLVDAPLDAGPHSVRFDASDLPGGFYVYRLTVGPVSQARQMAVLK